MTLEQEQQTQFEIELSLRGTGRSTRLADHYIQELFTNKK